MKQRFSSLDVKVIAHELSETLRDLRLSNAYDLSSRIFLLKFHKPGQRSQLLIDTGFRCHLTSFARTTAAEPSAFVSRLRKILRTRRVTGIQQIGTDRIIEFSFSDGQYRLFLEFYAGGNIVVTDADLKVIALWRRVPAGAGEEEIREGLTYSLEGRQNFGGAPPLTLDLVRDGLQKQVARAAEAKGKKASKKPGDALRRALAAAVPEFPPALLDHSFTARQFDAKMQPDEILKDSDKLQRLLDVLEDAKQQSDDVTSASPSKGYIIAKPAKQNPSKQPKPSDGSDADKENVGLLYEDFHPFRPRQFEGGDNTIIEIVGFNKAVDDFFSSLESQKLESRLVERELTAQRKIESYKADHERRIGALQQVQELNVRKAQAIEANIQRVEEATAAVNGLVAQGMDWDDIGRLIETEQNRQNPVARIIKLPLKLHENTVTLLLGEEEQFEDEDIFEGNETESENSDSERDEDDEDAEGGDKPSKADNVLSVDIDLALTAYANATTYYDQKRTAASKEEKTLVASEEALKKHEKKVQADLKKGLAQEKEVLRAVRPQLWFEKFYYFISSEGYLVIGSKDRTQSDMLYKRHLEKGDVWVHADLTGASHIVIKNKPEHIDSPIPPSTMAQAGTFCVSSSAAWDSKAMMGAWWVEAKAVTKLAPNGDYLDMGEFSVKGEKNHLPPAQLLLGFGVMFKVSESSMARHMKHRVPLGHVGGTNDEVGEEKQASEEPAKDSSREADIKIHADDSNDEQDSGREDGPARIYQNPLQTQGHSSAAGHASDEDDAHEDLEDEGDDGEEEEQSAAGGDQVEAENASAAGHGHEDQEDQEDQAETASVAASQAPSEPAKSTQQVRGKAGKKAKMKAKYAWQDDEDRALALRVLGSAKGQEKKQNQEEEKAAKAAADAAAKERRREQHRRAQAAGKEAEEARLKRLEGGDAGDDGEDADTETADISVIENYVGSPLPGDEIEDVLVICAPWDAMGAKFRWRIKMQPGGQKKGKAVREILGSWVRDIGARDKKRMPPADDDRFPEEQLLRREGELVKALKDTEVNGVVPVKSCTVVVSGGAGKNASKGKGGGGKSARGGRGSKKAR